MRKSASVEFAGYSAELRPVVVLDEAGEREEEKEVGEEEKEVCSSFVRELWWTHSIAPVHFPGRIERAPLFRAPPSIIC